MLRKEAIWVVLAFRPAVEALIFDFPCGLQPARDSSWKGTASSAPYQSFILVIPRPPRRAELIFCCGAECDWDRARSLVAIHSPCPPCLCGDFFCRNGAKPGARGL